MMLFTLYIIHLIFTSTVFFLNLSHHVMFIFYHFEYVCYGFYNLHSYSNSNAVFCRTVCKLWGECSRRGDGLYRHGPGLPRGLLHLHDLWLQAQREALLCRGKEGLLRTLLYREYDLLHALYAYTGSHTLIVEIKFLVTQNIC